MKKKRKSEMDDELRAEYDLHELLKGGVRGNMRSGTGLDKLSPISPGCSQGFCK